MKTPQYRHTLSTMTLAKCGCLEAAEAEEGLQRDALPIFRT
jgi:hypothetical protein